MIAEEYSDILYKDLCIYTTPHKIIQNNHLESTQNRFTVKYTSKQNHSTKIFTEPIHGIVYRTMTYKRLMLYFLYGDEDKRASQEHW